MVNQKKLIERKINTNGHCSDSEDDDTPKIWFQVPYIGPIGEKFAKKCILKLRKCFKKELKLILMYDANKVAFFYLTKPLYVSIYNHTSYINLIGCKVKYIGKTDKCLELRLNKHSDFRTSAVGKHLYNMRTFSSYCELVQHFCLFKFGTSFHCGLVSHQFSYFKEHSNHRQKQQLDSALFLGISLHQTTKSRPQCRHQSHQRTKSFQIGTIVLLFIFSALLIVYVGFIIAQHLCIVF